MGGLPRIDQVTIVLSVARLVVRKFMALLLTLFAASFLIYGMVAIAPGDPADLLAGGNIPNPARAAAIRAEYHLNDPFLVQYGHWVSGVLHGNLGQSYFFNTPVINLIEARAPTTLLLMAYTLLLTLVVGLGLGVLAGLRGGHVSSFVTAVTTVGMAMPSFVVAILLIWVFSSKLGWFPVFGSGEGGGFGGRISHLTLPAVSLMMFFTAFIARITRTAVVAELDSEHVETARVRGLPRGRIVSRHVLLNASAPILTVSGLAIAGMLAGTTVAEQAFSVNGMGSLLIQAARQQDLPVVMGISLIIVTWFVVINMTVDIINVMLDPRLKEGHRR